MEAKQNEPTKGEESPTPENRLEFKTGKIFQAIPAIMKEMGAVGKNQEVDSGPVKYKFRGIDDVYNALQKVMAKHCVFTVPYILNRKRVDVKSRSGTLGIHAIIEFRYRFFCSDGSFVDAYSDGEGIDYGDKVSNKCAAVAHKYALTQVFCIPYEDNDDPDKQTHDVIGKKQKPRTQTTKQPPKKIIHPNGINSDQLKFLHTTATTSNWKPDECKAMIRSMFGLETSKDLNPNQFQVLLKTIQNHTFKRAMEAFMSESKEEPPQENQGQDGPMFADDEIGF